MSIRNKTIFITCGAGFIGSTLASLLCEENDVVIFDNLARNTIQHSGLASHRRVTLVTGDVLDYAALHQAMLRVFDPARGACRQITPPAWDLVKVR